MGEGGDTTNDAALAKVLRLLLAAGEARVAGEAALAADGRRQPLGPALLAAALRRGLVRREGDRLFATAEARAYLKRRLCTAETPFADQHRDLAEVTVLRDGARERALANRLESPLASLTRLKEKTGEAFLPDTALAAGERLHADFTRGGLQPRLTMSWEPRIAGRQKGEAGAVRELTDTALAARLRVARAITAIGPELSGVALDVCCFMKGLETVERERQWPARSAKLMLRAALMALARHYAPPVPAGRQAHAWGAEGYRPEWMG
ncbi:MULTISPECIES: DUF6456 domain-containing protein [unclassified Shinella]|uniref:DUF6456 domain-containing protein n=1 Tax=unclassified Shinella TaxID=2643062 RepID=UPI00225C7737|nr:MULTISPECIES: DUF6456 domain-containing protein [unclassified Shinella]MCO5141452.1 DUF6456 domain-containing protein [Shinella sp.]MDC7254106.1 hypothetical protein [Shinella sp. YE25]CAI0336772.1 conserved hypothetical protein [Rhizobiaceae bacterium]CAK7255301.1 DUF6456 domain-containing protein [Shinella sp. WSC3-e]